MERISLCGLKTFAPRSFTHRNKKMKSIFHSILKWLQTTTLKVVLMSCFYTVYIMTTGNHLRPPIVCGQS